MSFPKTTGVKPNDFPPFKADWYNVSFENYEKKTDKNGDDYTEISLSLETTGATVRANLSHREDFLWKIQQFKIALGMADEETNPRPYLGTRLRAFIRNRVVKNKDTGEDMNFPDVRKFKPFDSSAPKAQSQTQPDVPPPSDNDLPF